MLLPLSLFWATRFPFLCGYHWLLLLLTGMDSTNVYAYISIIALLFCIPTAVLIEGPQLIQYGFKAAIAKVGLFKFLSDLFWIGMFYHLYNQLAKNTLERVAPLTHAVGNVLERVFVIGFSSVVFAIRKPEFWMESLLLFSSDHPEL